MEPYAFHDGIGKYGGTGFLQVVGSNSAPVHHLVPHAGGLVLVGKHGINQFLIDGVQPRLLAGHGFGHDFHGVNQRHGIPAHSPEPEVLRQSGHLVAPEHLA